MDQNHACSPVTPLPSAPSRHGRRLELALDRRVVTRAELATLDTGEIVARIEAAGGEQELLDELRAHRRRVAEVTARARSIDLARYARGIDQVLAMNLAARGLI